MSDTNTPPPSREQADAEFSRILKQAERGACGPADFKRAEQLLPHVSPELKR